MVKKQRVLYLDFIRTFACICVALVHFNASVSGYDFTGSFVYPNSLTPNHILGVYVGSIGVSLFFMVSGAALMLSNENTTLKNFYVKRFFNIYPSFWIAFFVATLLSFLLNKAFSMANLSLLLFSFVGMDGYLMKYIGGHFYQVGEWFLGCIIVIYLFWPLLREGVKKMPVLTWVGCLLLFLLFADKHQLWFFVRFIEIIFGMSIIKFKWGERPLLLLGLTFICALFTVLLLKFGIVGNSIWTIAFSAFLFVLLLNISQFIKNEKIKTLVVWVSGLTYPIFLVHHWIISKLVRGFDLSNFPYRYTVVMFIVYLIITIFAAVALKKLESRFLQILRKPK